jgi:hypothetical protein
MSDLTLGSIKLKSADGQDRMVMARMTRIRKRIARCRFVQDKCGQSLIEVALMVPVLFILMAYAVDFGYFFIAAANITSSARNAAQYSVLGYEGPAQAAEPVVGPASTTSSVAALAMSDLSLLSSATTTTVEVCSKTLGMTGNLPKCSSYGPAGTTYTPVADPEAPRFILQRVDVTYTVQPPIPLSFFNVSLLPNLTFHRQVSMRSMD